MSLVTIYGGTIQFRIVIEHFTTTVNRNAAIDEVIQEYISQGVIFHKYNPPSKYYANNSWNLNKFQIEEEFLTFILLSYDSTKVWST